MVDLTNPFGLTTTPTQPPAQTGNAVIDVANQLAQAYLDYKKTKDLNKLNLKRINAGLDPLSSLDADRAASSWSFSSGGASSVIPIAFAACAAVVLLYSLIGGGGGRRR